MGAEDKERDRAGSKNGDAPDRECQWKGQLSLQQLLLDKLSETVAWINPLLSLFTEMSSISVRHFGQVVYKWAPVGRKESAARVDVQ